MCTLANNCNHTDIPECGREKNDFSKRIFQDVCDMIEYNCDYNKEYFKIPYEECQMHKKIQQSGGSSTTDHKYIRDTKLPHLNSKEDTETPKTYNTLPASLNIITSPTMKDIFTEGFNSTNKILTCTEPTMLKIYPNLSTVIVSDLLTTSLPEEMSEKPNSTTSIIPINTTIIPPSILVTSELKINESWTSKSNDEASFTISHSPSENVQLPKTTSVQTTITYLVATTKLSSNNGTNIIDKVVTNKVTNALNNKKFVSPASSDTPNFRFNINRNCTRKINNTYFLSLTSTAAKNKMSYSSHATQEKKNTTISHSILSTITSNADSVITPSVLELSTSNINSHTKDNSNTITEISLAMSTSVFNLSTFNDTSKPSFINLQTTKNIPTNTEALSIPNTSENNTTIFNTRTNANFANQFKATTKMETEYNIINSLQTAKTSRQTPTCVTKTYPKNCNRPFTWETTIKGETRNIFQILRANSGDKVKTLRATTHWPRSLNYFNDINYNFFFGRHNES